MFSCVIGLRQCNKRAGIATAARTTAATGATTYCLPSWTNLIGMALVDAGTSTAAISRPVALSTAWSSGRPTRPSAYMSGVAPPHPRDLEVGKVVGVDLVKRGVASA